MIVHKQHTAVVASVGATGDAVNVQNEQGNSRLGWLQLQASVDPSAEALTAELQGRARPDSDWVVLTQVTGATSGWINSSGTIHTLRIPNVPLLPQMRIDIPGTGSASQAVTAWFGGGEAGQ